MILAKKSIYIDYEWFVQLTHQGVYFVTRLKDNASFELVENRPVPKGTNVLKDQVVYFHAQAVPDRFSMGSDHTYSWNN